MQKTKASAEGLLDVDLHFAFKLIHPSVRGCVDMSSYSHANPVSEELDIYRASQNASLLWSHPPHCSTLGGYLNVSAEQQDLRKLCPQTMGWDGWESLSELFPSLLT